MSPFNSRTRAEEVVETFASRVKGRTFLITGTSEKGLGAYTATSLARGSPAHLILVSRTKAKVDPVLAEIAAIDAAVRTTFVEVDLADQDSVRRGAKQILDDATIPHIDVVINNAGVMRIKEFTTDKKGNEMQFSSNHLGHFLLTGLLMPKILAAGKGARIVNLTSLGHYLTDVRWDDLTFGQGKTYDGWSGYGQSKTANILFSVELARRLKERGIASFSVHPGAIFETTLTRHLTDVEEAVAEFNVIVRRNTGLEFEMNEELKDISEGTSSTLVAALDPELEPYSGSYIADCKVGKPQEYAVDLEKAKRLWKISEELVGEKFDI